MYNIPTTCQIKNLASIYNEYFNNITDGTFIEIGAYDGESYSNTSCLADIGWRGIYVEPVLSFFNKCKQRHIKNNITTINCSVGTEEKEIHLYIGDTLTTTSKEQVERYSKIDWAQHISFTSSKCNQIRLETLLTNNNIKPNFDLLVVDVEGKEGDVISSFDLLKWSPKMMIVELEDNHPSFMQYESHIAEHSKVRQTILQANYKEIYKDHINTIFIKNN
jgi:FkbM family methyltransferase